VSGLAIQKAIVGRLRTDGGVTALVGTRVYDQPPPNPTFPYISLGPDNVVPSRADCYDGSDVTIQIDAWSRAVGFPEVKAISEAVRLALHEYPLSVTDHRVIDVAMTEARVLRDPDALTNHAALTFRVLTEPVN
jgi:hypothetical protein